MFQLAAGGAISFYLVGGTVRDWLLGRNSHDLDIAVPDHAMDVARRFREELGGGALVDLSGPDDEAARVVWQEEQIDFAAFRGGASAIEADLRLRDFTINAMAIGLADLEKGGTRPVLLDPTGGLADLRAGRIRHCPGAFAADPVRMLRGYRLFATLGFHLAGPTRAAVKRHAPRIGQVAAERIGYELALIFSSARTSATLEAMADDGLLPFLLPELYRGEGVEQPEFHHLDVFGHSFLALKMMEQIIADPRRFFPGNGAALLTNYLHLDNAVRCLKWAALLHDVGKPATRAILTSETGRVTFYRHDEEGARIFRQFAERGRWSRADIERTGGLIGMHMHPFHLCNVARGARLTRRAALNLCRRAGVDLPGLFMLVMADSMASRGEKKPARMEEELIVLFDTVQKIYNDHIEPVLRGPRLLSGDDLITEFALQPGPLFATILEELEVVRVEGTVTDRRSALAWVGAYLQNIASGRSLS